MGWVPRSRGILLRCLLEHPSTPSGCPVRMGSCRREPAPRFHISRVPGAGKILLPPAAAGGARREEAGVPGSRAMTWSGTSPAVEEARRCRGPLVQPVCLVTNHGPSLISRQFRRELDDPRIAARVLGAFSRVRIGCRTPTRLGLPERFDETLKCQEVRRNLYADPRDARWKLAILHQQTIQARPH